MNTYQRWKRALVVLYGLLLAIMPLAAQSSGDPYQEFQAGNYEEASRLARNIIRASPANIEARVVLGWSSLIIGDYQEALTVSAEGLKLAPNDPRLLAIAGESQYYLNNWLEALPLLERYVATAPTGAAIARVYSFMGEIFIGFGEYHHADIAFATALYYDQSVSNWWYRRGFVFEQLGELPRAIAAYRQAIALDPALNAAREAIERLQ